MPIFRSETVEADRDVDHSVHLTIDLTGRPVNVLSRQVLADLDEALDAVLQASRTTLLVVRSGKKSGFVAGADLVEFEAVADAAAAQAISAAGQKVFAKLAALPMPTVAAVSGFCLGGGLELALACDYRLVFDSPQTQLGLPEVRLGLLPAWGGTQRLPRLVGLERALRMILSGNSLSAREALACGLADATAATEGELRRQFSALALRAVHDGKRNRQRLPLRTWRQRMLESTPVGRRVVFRATTRALRHRVPDDMPSPFEALEAVRVGLARGMEEGYAFERAAAGRLATSPACRNLVGVFLGRERAKKLPEELAAERAEVQRVGVVGAGVMGAGIAQLAALKGCHVIVREVSPEALEAGKARVAGLFAKAIEHGVLGQEDARHRLDSMGWTLNWDEFADVDAVVEAAAEDLQVKREVFAALGERARPDAVLATNTSSLPVASLQEGVPGPGRVAGLHFFNPVHKMPLVEVVRTPATAAAALATLARWAVRLGKTPVLVGDGPGFVVNRILMPYLNEAVLLVAGGMDITQVDRVMKRFGMMAGPLEVLDQVGLDVAAHVARSTAPALGERFGANPAFEKMCDAGWLGQKSGRGFYVHKGKRARPNPGVRELLRAGGEPEGAALPPAARLAEARERMVLLGINEAAQVLAEGLAADAATVDLAMVLGTGWAPHRGGPLHYADARGPADVVRALEGLAARHGKRFEPCAELRRRAGAQESFTRPAGAAV
jgi:3-hydroxyacyl-CoA dehydrogenase/enoyl-CoA hydratase/3-hydroxybutyryl-CoA epimerase